MSWNMQILVLWGVQGATDAADETILTISCLQSKEFDALCEYGRPDGWSSDNYGLNQMFIWHHQPLAKNICMYQAWQQET